MIPVANPIPEPDDFDQTCRKKGKEWLSKNPESPSHKFPGYWREFQDSLADGFTYRCGWSAMHIGTDGAVDHFHSRSGPRGRELAYEWSNYRYISTTINSSKQALDAEVLDPFEVQSGWFEVRLPSFQLIRTDQVPKALREKADYTIKRLKLVNGSKFIKNRKYWYQEYRRQGLPLDRLREYAPLVAEAIDRWVATGRPLPDC
jgi:hypothetical protein